MTLTLRADGNIVIDVGTDPDCAIAAARFIDRAGIKSAADFARAVDAARSSPAVA